MNEQDVFPALKWLCEIPGPAGHEGPVQDELERQWRALGIETRRDKIGNLFGHVDGDGPRIAIVGHADSIGFVVQQVMPDGFLRVAFNTAAVSPDARFLPGTPVSILAKGGQQVPGTFGLRSGHLAGAEGKKQPVLFEDAFIDAGMDSKDDVLSSGIDVGTPVVFGNEVVEQGCNITGPSMDNRVAGVLQSALASVIKDAPSRPDVTLVSTVQEEIGMKGAAAAARQGAFDRAIIIDVGLVGDIPTSAHDRLDTRLGKGPVVVYKDFGIHYDATMIRELEAAAVAKGIPFQRGVFANYQTDGVHFLGNGVPVALVAVPCRYTHTHFETVRAGDVVNTARLLAAFACP